MGQAAPSAGPVCIVDDDAWVCDSLSVLLETHGYAVTTYASGEEFLQDKRRSGIKCLVIDQHMPGLAGLDVVAKLRRDGFCPPAVLITGRLDAALAKRAGALGIRMILEKPFPARRLLDVVVNSIAEDPPNGCPGELG
jgi:FixJ family two-component response regulator